jgi:hypothetical protein
MTTGDTTQQGAAPPPVPQAQPAPVAKVFRDPSKITRILTTILWVSLALDAIAVVSGMLEYNLLQEIQSGAISSADMSSAAEGNIALANHVDM